MSDIFIAHALNFIYGGLKKIPLLLKDVGIDEMVSNFTRDRNMFY